VKKISTRNAVAEVHFFVGVKSKHCLFLALTARLLSEEYCKIRGGKPYHGAALLSVRAKELHFMREADSCDFGLPLKWQSHRLKRT
jgi:hypothetical protein